jgi:hypothetical protein
MASEKFDFAEFLAVLEAKRAALDALIGSYRAAMSIGALGQPGDVTISIPAGSLSLSGSAPTTAIDLPQGALLGLSIPAAIKLLLSAARRKLTTREITAGLKDGGVESTSKFFENTVTTALHRLKASGDVLKFNDGWALAEFYPESLRSRLAAQGEQKTPKKPKARKRTAKKQVQAFDAKPGRRGIQLSGPIVPEREKAG